MKEKVKELRTHDKDTGSSEVQIAQLTGKILSLSKHVKQNSDIFTRTVGMITDPIKANKILENDESDMIAMARAFLSNPRWVWDAADILGAEIETPNQYARRFKKSI